MRKLAGLLVTPQPQRNHDLEQVVQLEDDNWAGKGRGRYKDGEVSTFIGSPDQSLQVPGGASTNTPKPLSPK